MSAESRLTRLVWPTVVLVLLAWNSVVATYSSPLVMLQHHDGSQYHLLVRNRLHGHDEVGDTSHTVQGEGRNPIWRPGLVWIEEGLARWLGSVSAAARDEELSHLSFEWTRTHVTVETKKYLASLPFRLDIRPLGGHVSGPTITLMHGNQTLNTVYVTEDRTDSFLEKMAKDLGARAEDVICFGHTHKPWQRVVGGIQFVNAGSVGSPKDGDPRACYASITIDGSGARVEFVRVEYDIDEAVRAIRESELPSEFADVLKAGGLPALATGH